MDDNTHWNTTASAGGLTSAIEWCKERLTAASDRYYGDAIYRTRINVIALQVMATIIAISIIATAWYLETYSIDFGILIAYFAHRFISVTWIIHKVGDIRSLILLIGVVLAVLIRAIFDYMIATIALRPAQEALAKEKRFIRDVAHELRTPMSVMKTNSEIAVMTDESDTYKEMVKSNVEEVDRLSAMIDNLILMSALEQPERSSFVAVDLRAVASYCIDTHNALAQKHDVTLSLVPGTHAFVSGNKTALEEIVLNVLKNAIIYNKPGGSVTVLCSTAPRNFVELEVRDTGVGIAEENLRRIYEPFFREDQSRTRGSGGSGIGLTLVVGLVRMHRGTLGVNSKLGEGTVVTIRIPKAKEAKNNGS